MSGNTEGKPARNTWMRRIASILVGLAISLVVGKIVETVSDREWLESATEVQSAWMDAVAQTSPVGVATTYWDELSAAFGDHQVDSDFLMGVRPHSVGVMSPLVALFYTAGRFFDSGGFTAIIQLALGALALAVMNFLRRNGQSIFFDDLYLNLFALPALIVLFASLIGMVLWGVMMGSLYALSWVTSLAAAAAGATGVVGFCWLCITKLGEKGAEHVMTPKI
jgi:hypothetical protein